MGKIIKFDISNTELYSDVEKIRTIVFVEEQNVPFEMEWEYEKDCVYYLIYHRRKAVGTARYRVVNNVIKFERFAFLEHIRGKGLGRDILRFMLNDVRLLKKSIMLNAQEYAVDFYKKTGFVVCGEKFMEAGIPHYPMEYIEQNSLDKAMELAICRR